MTTVYIVRHAELDYSLSSQYGFWGFGKNFAPLAKEGIEKAEETSRDPRLKSAQFIISSPYTRALQTAQIISKNTGIEVAVEVGLHEWLADTTNNVKNPVNSAKEFREYKGVHPKGAECCWEELEHMRRRMRAVLDKYSHLDKIIVVGHEMSLKTLTYFESLERGGILEFQYDPDAEDSKYSF